MSGHKSIHDYGPTVRSMTVEAFATRFPHPILFGREVLEEEFRFSTVVTDDRSLSEVARESPDVFRIRQWVIAVRKAPEAPAQDRVFLGRSETNDLCVPHQTVSKLHAYFQRETSPALKWSVVDTGSSNGTRHNGTKLPSRAKAHVLDGDTLVFGRCVFQWLSARSLYEKVHLLTSTRGP
jgi:hypothetical protein